MTALLTASLHSVELSGAVASDNSQWVHIIPAGTNFGRDGRGPYTLSNAQAVLKETQAYHGRTKMLVDFDHQAVHAAKTGRGAPAAGWIVGLELRMDGIWAKVEWLATTAQMIRQKAYRYVSPVFQHDPQGNIKRIINVALTNSPNLELTALAAAEISMDKEMQELRDLLGLSADADFATTKAAISALQSSSQSSAIPDPSSYVPIGEFTRVVAEANQLRQGVTEQAARTHVDEKIRSGQLVPHLKEWAVSLCTVNMPQFEKFLEQTGPALNKLLTASHATGAPPPKLGGANGLSESQMAICSAMGLSAEEYTKARGAHNETD